MLLSPDVARVETAFVRLGSQSSSAKTAGSHRVIPGLLEYHRVFLNFLRHPWARRQILTYFSLFFYDRRCK